MQPPPDLPDFSELQAQLRQLEELLALPPERLSKLRQTIEFIERMSQAERDAMHIRLSQITQSTPKLKAEINQIARVLSPDLHSSFSQFWHASSAEERENMRSMLDTLSDEEKSTFLEEKIATFVQHRDKVFTTMKQSLENKKKAKPSSSPKP